MLKKLSLFCLFAAFVTLVADTLKTNDGNIIEGVFKKCHKETITFQSFENTGEQLEINVARIVQLKVSPNAPGKAIRVMAPKQPLEVMVRSFENGKFSVVINGKREKINARTFISLEVPFTLNDFYTRKKLYDEQKQSLQQAELEPQKAVELIVKGKGTIIHFDDGSAASIRQGNLCRQLCEKSRGRLALVIVPIKALNEPMATLNDIQTTPQFWFFAPNGKLIEKLADRFAEEDIEKAANKARKGK